MSEEATETPAKARRWNAFVCPGCRLVFRVPRTPEGRGVVCPSCRRLLRLPGRDEKAPKLVNRTGLAGASAEPEPSPDESSRHHSRSSESIWGRISGKLVGKSRSPQLLLLIVSVLVALAFLSIFGLVRLVGGGVDRTRPSGENMTEQALPSLAGEFDLRDGGKGNPELRTSMAIEPGTFLPRAETIANRLVDASTVREILPLVRNPEIAGPRMRDWFARHGFESEGIHAFNNGGGLDFSGRVVRVPVLMDDFTRRQLAFVVDGDSLLVDWESWAGWSEMEWSDFMDRRPVEPKLFRVYATQGNYFNFGFAQSDSWRCYELESPDRQVLLFGYGKIGSEADNRLGLVEKKEPRPLTLKLRYPESAPAANQVIIDSFVADGWVTDVGDGSPK